ncbi:pyrroline-5-carboxylate reductase [Reticulibacter mediterranei]|uniref:Pyrroline-5-carboxylate reductase n=1 Tax=Reticulibacter mediterranei TaxID=2778369 RepID=A0A8J3IKB0_9CHLR|nr:pyrroline-5-carboxylate reductase [Reticulibacter mediterranei]GHO95358.1 pyrroline-5-carboxylate reductase [Reticulibacter mediterranei]
MLAEKLLFFAGAGAISEAMLKGLLEAGVVPAEQITVNNRKNRERLFQLGQSYGIHISQQREQEIAAADIIILAMKPFDIHQALQEIGANITPQQMVISVVAGVSTETIESQLVEGVAVIRAMPNTSSFVQASATAISRGKHATIEQLEQGKQIFAAIGSVTEVEEQQLDAVTGLSGSGPAYIYYVIESLMQAGQQVGLSEETCRELLIQTLYGSAKMLKVTGKNPQELRRQVTSPNGTTMAGLAVLEQGDLPDLLKKAVEQATRRATEMGQEISAMQPT